MTGQPFNLTHRFGQLPVSSHSRLGPDRESPLSGFNPECNPAIVRRGDRSGPLGRRTWRWRGGERLAQAALGEIGQEGGEVGA